MELVGSICTTELVVFQLLTETLNVWSAFPEAGDAAKERDKTRMIIQRIVFRMTNSPVKAEIGRFEL
jgi:hypothetical protein